MMRTIALLVACIACGGVQAQGASVLGKWSGTLATDGGRPWNLQVEIAEAEGIWVMHPAPGTRTTNACLGRSFSVTIVSRSADAIQLQVDGSKVVPGCITTAVALKVVDANTLEGTLANGRAVRLTR